EINSGIYAIELSGLFEALHGLATDNAQGEYYLTDLVANWYRQRRVVETLCIDDPVELRGVNTRVDLADLGRVQLGRTRRARMLQGVTLEDPDSTWIESDVTIGEDTVIAPGVTLTGRTTIGQRCHIRSGTRITDSAIGDE